LSDNIESIKEEAYKAGFEFEKRFHGCAQCAVGALYEVFPELRNEDVFRSAGGLGGGVGLTCKGHCGALSGGVKVLSQMYGRELNEIEDPEKKRAIAAKLGEQLAQRFLDAYGTVICEEIQHNVMGRSFSLLDPDDYQAFEEHGGHSKACPSVVGKGVQWAAEMIIAEKGGDATVK